MAAGQTPGNGLNLQVIEQGDWHQGFDLPGFIRIPETHFVNRLKELILESQDKFLGLQEKLSGVSLDRWPPTSIKHGIIERVLDFPNLHIMTNRRLKTSEPTTDIVEFFFITILDENKGETEQDLACIYNVALEGFLEKMPLGELFRGFPSQLVEGMFENYTAPRGGDKLINSASPMSELIKAQTGIQPMINMSFEYVLSMVRNY